jgi:hypothetical protein
VGRDFAGVLGPLAFTVVLVRHIALGSGLYGAMEQALVALFTFAAIGYIVGGIACRTVRESVRTQINVELDALQKKKDEGQGDVSEAAV